MDINWDEVAQEADDSPRSLLAEVLARADDIEGVVILVKGKDGIQRRWNSVQSEEHIVAMLELAKFAVLQEAFNR